MTDRELLSRCDALAPSRTQHRPWKPSPYDPYETKGLIDSDLAKAGGTPSFRNGVGHRINDSLPLHADNDSLRLDAGGVVRVGKSRVKLDLVVDQYQSGVAPEEMVQAYDSLMLADVYSVIGYYLRHKDELDAYLNRRIEEAEALQAKIEADGPAYPA